MLEVATVSCTLGGHRILRDVSVQCQPGLLTAIIGPNGSGKTTLLKIMSGELEPSTGEVFYGCIPVRRSTAADFARSRAVLSQLSELSFPMLVEEVVMMGRYPHFHVRPGRADQEACDAAFYVMEITHLRGRNYLTLSGGERQMVHFARVYAQILNATTSEQKILLLDEPTTFLDVRHQHQFMKVVKKIAADGAIVVAVLHDIALAAQYADRIVALKSGVKIADDATTRVVTAALFSNLYGVSVQILHHPTSGFPLIIFD
jgi:iron complex transport system ATP-binding protein